MTVVCSSASSLTMIVTIVPTFNGLTATLGQQNVVQPPLLIQRDIGGVVGPATVLEQQPQSQMPSQAYVSCAMGPPQVGYLFQS